MKHKKNKQTKREYLMTTLCNELSKLNRDSKANTTKVRTATAILPRHEGISQWATTVGVACNQGGGAKNPTIIFAAFTCVL